VATNTQNYATAIENHIRKYPEQWLWLHQRWKTKTCQAKE
jgi:KDO2-lipid IV(A) lauroyltransferase